jgi:hypothetical protein
MLVAALTFVLGLRLLIVSRFILRVGSNMTHVFRAITAFALLTCSVFAQTAKLDSILDMREFVRDWTISKQFTVDVANTMPAELYSFKPNPDEMTFGEQMVHIAGANVFRFHQITGVQPPFEFDPAHLPPTDKAAAVKMLEQSFDYVIGVLPGITPEQLKRSWHVPSWKGRTDPDGRAMIIGHSARFICG